MDITIALIMLVARIVERGMETIRTMYISKGHKFLATGVGIVKVVIWLISTGLVLTNLQNIPAILTCIAGYGIGTLLEMETELRIGIEPIIVRIFPPLSQRTHRASWGSGFRDHTDERFRPVHFDGRGAVTGRGPEGKSPCGSMY